MQFNSIYIHDFFVYFLMHFILQFTIDINASAESQYSALAISCSVIYLSESIALSSTVFYFLSILNLLISIFYFFLSLFVISFLRVSISHKHYTSVILML